MVGVLKLSLYGTRDAAANFQKEVYKLMTSIGFTQSGYNASLYQKGRRSTRGGVTYGDAATGVRDEWNEMRRAGCTHGAAGRGAGGYHRTDRGSTRGGGAYGAAVAGVASGKIEGVSVLVHGDDFVATGNREDIAEFRKALARRFTVKDKVIGSRADLGELQETRVLNRIIRWTTKGWEI